MIKPVIQTARGALTCIKTDRNPYFQKQENVMDRKQFDSLDESVKEKLRNCKSEAEMQKIIAEAGLVATVVDGEEVYKA